MGPPVKFIEQIPITSQPSREKSLTFPMYFSSFFKVRNRLKFGGGGQA